MVHSAVHVVLLNRIRLRSTCLSKRKCIVQACLLCGAGVHVTTLCMGLWQQYYGRSTCMGLLQQYVHESAADCESENRTDTLTGLSPPYLPAPH